MPAELYTCLSFLRYRHIENSLGRNVRIKALLNMWIALPYPARKSLALFRRCWLVGGASDHVNRDADGTTRGHAHRNPGGHGPGKVTQNRVEVVLHIEPGPIAGRQYQLRIRIRVLASSHPYGYVIDVVR